MLLNAHKSWFTDSSAERGVSKVMNGQTRTYKARFRVTVSAHEAARILERAHAAGLSASAYLRASGLGHPIRSRLDYDAVQDMAKLNGDQGRLAGLLKLWLEDQRGRDAPEIDVRRLLERIDALQGRLIDVVSRV